jgi:ABC-2 type transport system permease protein
MTPSVTWATALRVLTQLRRDPRTVGLILFVPTLLVVILRYVFDGSPETFDRVGGPMLGLFPFVSMFVVTSVTMLRERITGTLERLMTTPLGKLDLLLGYALAFALLAAVQASFVSGVAILALGLDLAGSTGTVIGLAIGNALLGMSLGLFASAFARTEFQAVQFLPAVILPQLLLCGLFAPREAMAAPLQWLSDVFPLTYAVDGMQRVVASAEVTGELVTDLAVVVGCVAGFLVLGAVTLQRRSG